MSIMGGVRRKSHRESGQAAVEAALTLPLMMFMILGSMQMFLIMHGRLLAQYAVFRAVRAGSMNHGDCVPMMHSAIASLIPSYVSFLGTLGGGGTPGQKLGNVFRAHMANRFDPGMTGGHTGAVVWMFKEHPTPLDVAVLPQNEDSQWDQDDTDGGNPVPLRRLEVQMVYWFPLKIPFANWVISRIALANWALRDYTAQSPYMPTSTSNWTANASSQPFSGQDFEAAIKGDIVARYDRGEYSFPLQVSYTMRMMTPAQTRYFRVPTCGFP
jgi:hypothetical protein